jgi:hypothetical protein
MYNVQNCDSCTLIKWISYHWEVLLKYYGLPFVCWFIWLLNCAVSMKTINVSNECVIHYFCSFRQTEVLTVSAHRNRGKSRIRQYSRYFIWDSNQEPPEYTSWALALDRPVRWFVFGRCPIRTFVRIPSRLAMQNFVVFMSLQAHSW